MSSPSTLVLLSPVPDGTAPRLEALGWRCLTPEPDDESAVLAALSVADACYGRLTPERLAAARRLTWLQAPTAGLDNFWFPELRASQLTVTNMRGIYSDFIADHAMGFVLAFARGLHVYLRHQQGRRWAPGAPVRHLAGATLAIVGLGGIGLAVAERARSFGLKVIGIDPHPKGRPPWLEAVLPPEQLPDVLPAADYVILATPLTAETDGWFDAAMLARMKRDAILINVGRGRVVQQAALVAALRAGALGGAALDVFEEEPLPPDDPLWNMDNVLVTPHVGDRTAIDLEGRRADILVENARRRAAGEPLLNLVDKTLGYATT